MHRYYNIGGNLMFSVGEKVIYGESGVCTVAKIDVLDMPGMPKDKLYYYLVPLIGSGSYFTPVDTQVFMRPVMTADEALAFIDSIPSIEPAICLDNRFNHVDAFYRDLFKLHTCEALVSIIKGLRARMEDKKTKSSRAEQTVRRAREILYGELSVALGIPYPEMIDFVSERVGFNA